MVSAVQDFLSISKGYIMDTATNSVVEEKMEPITSAPVTQQLVVTGQYLYDTFVKADESQVTKMDIIRTLSTNADALQIKGACDKMVEAAVLLDYPQGKPKKAERKAKEQSAMNARTIIQSAWGALQHVASRIALTDMGYDENTGYQDMRVLAKKALDTAKINWKGEPVLTDKDKEVARLRREQKAETQALVDVQKANPRLVNESLGEWQQRTLDLAKDAMDEARETATAERVEKAVKGLTEKLDDNDLYLVAVALFEHLGLEVNKAEEETEEGEEGEETPVGQSDALDVEAEADRRIEQVA
jgi:hypothetical protein